MATLAAMLPRTRSEFQLWVVSTTAGISEEFLFRGYLIWALHHWVGWWVAAALSSIVFSFGHSYQGPRGVMQTALIGLAFAALVATFNSLLPAMVIHALVDIGSGYLGWVAFREVVVPGVSSQAG